MREMLVEIRNFFVQERIYFYLLVVAVFLYAAIFFVHRTARERKPPSERPAKIEHTALPTPSAKMVEAKFRAKPELHRRWNVFLILFGTMLSSGVLLSVLAFKRWRRKQGLVPKVLWEFRVSWGIRELLKVGILFFWFGIVFNLILSLLKTLWFMDTSSYVLILFHTLLIDFIAVWFIVRAARASGARISDLIGFRSFAQSLRELWLGVYTYVAIFPAFLCLLAALIFIMSRFSYEPPPHPLVNVFLTEEQVPIPVILFSLILACGVGPVVEEIFFRGFLYPALRNYWGVGWATAVTSGFFALVHENLFSFVPIFFLGVVFCYLYEKRKSILASISLHVLHNSAFIVYFFLMKSIAFSEGG